MSDMKTEGIVNLTVPVVMDFPNLHEARKFKRNGKESGEPKYSANFVFDPASADLKTLKETAVRIARAKWPDRNLKELQFPFLSGDTLASKAQAKGKDANHLRGKVVIISRSKYEPRLSVIENKKVVELDGAARVASKSKFYRGVHVLAQFNFVAYEGGNNPDGVTAYLNMVCSLNMGEKLAGSGPSAAEVFKGYVGVVSAEDPTGGKANEESLEDILGV